MFCGQSGETDLGSHERMGTSRFFYKSFIAHKIRTYVCSERIGKLYLLPISRILPREVSKGRDKSAVRIFSVRQ